MVCFRWISSQRLSPEFDLRRRGWRLAVDLSPDAIDCVRLLDATGLDSGDKLFPLRSRSLALGVDSSGERARWLARGFGDVLARGAGLDEIALRAGRLLAPRWSGIRRHGDWYSTR